MTYSGPLPDIEDPLTAPFWQAAREHRLVAQKCESCHALRWQPSPICPECLVPGGSWAQLSGRGEVYSCTTYRRAMHSSFTDLVPYTVALISLEEGIDMMGMLTVTGQIGIGDRVEVDFVDVDDVTTIVQWSPRSAEI
jgi:uncharacterized protein